VLRCRPSAQRQETLRVARWNDFDGARCALHVTFSMNDHHRDITRQAGAAAQTEIEG
jgi:hypothetical protein